MIGARCVASSRRQARCRRRAAGGTASLEALLAVPLCLLLGLGALQWALLMHARHVIEYALQRAARHAATLHGSPEAIEQGLAVGLIPLWGGQFAVAAPAVAHSQAAERVARARHEGWLAWRQRAPGATVFDDWAEIGRDPRGDPIDAVREIPNDNLRYRTASRGSRSGVTLLDANVLQLELIYAVPLQVPLAGSLAVATMRAFDRCAADLPQRIGLLGWSGADIGGAQAWRCPFYRVAGSDSATTGRWPVRVRAYARMQSPLRFMAAPTGNAPAGGSGTLSANRAPQPERTSGASAPGPGGDRSSIGDGTSDGGRAVASESGQEPASVSSAASGGKDDADVCDA